MAKKKTQSPAINPALKRLPDLKPRKPLTKKPAAKKTVSAKTAKPKDTAPPKKTRKKRAHATRPTPAEIPLIIQRQNLVWDLRGAKVSFRQIVRHLETLTDQKTGKPKFAKIGVSLTTVFEDYSGLLDLQYKNQQLTVEQYVEAEINTLDGVEFEAQRNYQKSGGKEYGDLIVTCVKERAKLRNLYKPRKIEIDARGALARLLGISVEELPADDSAA